MEGRSSFNNNTNNPNPSKNKGKAPATSPPTAPSSSSQNAAKSSGLPPTPPSSMTVREQDRYMPIANVVRIMRRGLPPHAKISDEAKETVQECVSEFIAFVTEEANERCRTEHRKTVTGEDLLWAMGRLGFDNYVDPLKTYLKKYRANEAVGLGKSEMASRQRRHANRAAGIQIQGSSSNHQPSTGVGAGSAGVGVMPVLRVMPPLAPMMNNLQHGILSPPTGNQAYLNGGSGSSSGMKGGFNSGAVVGSEHGPNPNPNPGPGSNEGFNLGGGSNGGLSGFDMPNPSTPTGSESEMSFYDLFHQFK